MVESIHSEGRPVFDIGLDLRSGRGEGDRFVERLDFGILALVQGQTEGRGDPAAQAKALVEAPGDLQWQAVW